MSRRGPFHGQVMREAFCPPHRGETKFSQRIQRCPHRQTPEEQGEGQANAPRRNCGAGADGHAPVGANLDGRADAPNISPPRATQGRAQHGALFFPSHFQACCVVMRNSRWVSWALRWSRKAPMWDWRFRFRGGVRWQNRVRGGPVRIDTRARFCLWLGAWGHKGS